MVELVNYCDSQLPLLVEAADALMYQLYPRDTCDLDSVQDLQRKSADIAGFYQDGELLGIAALVPMGQHTAELKRVFVQERARGNGIAVSLIGFLEQRAREQGKTQIVLETGVYQPEAIALYKKLGYTECPPYAVSADTRLSVFMGKALAAQA